MGLLWLLAISCTRRELVVVGRRSQLQIAADRRPQPGHFASKYIHMQVNFGSSSIITIVLNDT